MKIKLMADYQCHPLWRIDDEIIGDIDPSSLPLLSSTVSRLNKWAEMYDKTLNQEDPCNSGFSSLKEEAEFENEGISLLSQVALELSPQYEVIYYSQKLKQTIKP
jgi:hypothetical protein